MINLPAAVDDEDNNSNIAQNQYSHNYCWHHKICNW